MAAISWADHGVLGGLKLPSSLIPGYVPAPCLSVGLLLKW